MDTRSKFGFLELKEIPFNSLNEATCTRIEASHNQLEQISSDVYRFKKLVEFYAHSNVLASLPSKLSEYCTSLRTISISSNRLTSSALEAAHLELLPNLQILECGDNLLTEFPVALCDALKLTKLVISHNQLTNLPEEFSNLVVLEYLGIAHNQLVNVPLCLIGLKALKGVSFIGNPGSASTVKELKKLQAVIIGVSFSDNQRDASVPEAMQIQWQRIHQEPRVSTMQLESSGKSIGGASAGNSYRINHGLSSCESSFRVPVGFMNVIPNGGKYAASSAQPSPDGGSYLSKGSTLSQ